MMTRGMALTVIIHIAGSLAAMAGGWALIGYLAGSDSRNAMQFTILIGGAAWGIWKLIQIALRNDDMGNRIIALFDNPSK